MQFSFQNQNEIQLSNCEKAQRSHLIQQKIWKWHDLHHRFEKYFKRQLNMLLEQNFCDQHNQTDMYSCNTFSDMVLHPSST